LSFARTSLRPVWISWLIVGIWPAVDSVWPGP
jgi:hypothetical protein